MTSMTKRGRESVRTPSVKTGHEEAMLGILDNLSTVYSGYCVLEHLGGTCRRRMETGRMYTAGSVGGYVMETEIIPEVATISTLALTVHLLRPGAAPCGRQVEAPSKVKRWTGPRFYNWNQ